MHAYLYDAVSPVNFKISPLFSFPKKYLSSPANKIDPRKKLIPKSDFFVGDIKKFTFAGMKGLFRGWIFLRLFKITQTRRFSSQKFFWVLNLKVSKSINFFKTCYMHKLIFLAKINQYLTVFLTLKISWIWIILNIINEIKLGYYKNFNKEKGEKDKK